MQEQKLKQLLNAINELTSELHDMDSISILVKDHNNSEFANITLHRNTVIQEIKLTQRSEIIVKIPTKA